MKDHLSRKVYVVGVFATKKAAEQHVKDNGLNPAYTDIAGYRVEEEVKQKSWWAKRLFEK